MTTEERIECLEKDGRKTLEIVTELKMAICGSEKIGIEGMAKKVIRHDEYIENDKRNKWMIAGGVAVIGFIWATLISFWSKIFG